MSDYISAEETAALISDVHPDVEWVMAELERIDPLLYEHGNDGAMFRALLKLVMELRDKLEAKP